MSTVHVNNVVGDPHGIAKGFHAPISVDSIIVLDALGS